MMNKFRFICRILRIQKHKNYKFLYVSGFKYSRQLIIKNDEYLNCHINPMSVITGECFKTINDAGKESYQITEITSVVNSSGNCSYAIDFLSNKNFMMQVCKQRILIKIEQFLQENGFLSTNTPYTMNYRGTSIASPLKISGEFVDRYCKITHELELKKLVLKTLSPVYEIGYVTRDIYSTNKGNFEYNVLEFVSPIHEIEFIEQFIKAVINIVNDIADEMGIEHRDFSTVQTVELNGGLETEKLQNVIYTNRSVESPLVKSVDGKRSETIWFYEGISMAHGYNDENSYQNVYDECQNQMKILENKKIKGELSEDFLEFLRIGLPNTISLGFGIDLFFYKFFCFDSFKDYLSRLC